MRQILHLTVLIILTELPHADEEWFCSELCRTDGTSIYCYCHTEKGGDMIQCHLGNACTKHEWYHMKCVDVTRGIDGKHCF